DCHHPVAPSGGDTMVTLKRLYHGLPASSPPHRPVDCRPHPPLSSMSNGSFRDRENAFSYTMDISLRQNRAFNVNTEQCAAPHLMWRLMKALLSRPLLAAPRFPSLLYDRCTEGLSSRYGAARPGWACARTCVRGPDTTAGGRGRGATRTAH